MVVLKIPVHEHDCDYLTTFNHKHEEEIPDSTMYLFEETISLSLFHFSCQYRLQ